MKWTLAVVLVACTSAQQPEPAPEPHVTPAPPAKPEVVPVATPVR